MTTFKGKSFAEVLKKDYEKLVDGEGSGKKEVYKTFFYNSYHDETSRFAKAMVGFVRTPGLTYGVNNNLLEQGIISVVATPQGLNLCLLEDKVEGDLNQLLQDAGEWKSC